MPKNTPDVLRKAKTGSEAVQGIPIPESPLKSLEITTRGFPEAFIRRYGKYLKWDGKRVTHQQWCEAQVERIGKIPGHSPRIVQGKSGNGEYEGKIMIVDDEYILPEPDIHTIRTQIKQFHEREKSTSSV